MARWATEYRGFTIVAGTAWSTSGPWKPTYAIAVTLADGEKVTVCAGDCVGPVADEDTAWGMCVYEAKRVIDSFALLADGPAHVATGSGEGIVICGARETSDRWFRGVVHVGVKAGLPVIHQCPMADASFESALRRAEELASRLYPGLGGCARR